MHLTKEATLIMCTVATPIFLIFILLGLFWPDFGIRATDVANIPGHQAAAAHDSPNTHH